MASANCQDHLEHITFFAETNFRNAKRRFGIKTDDRRRHMYIIGKTGMGKTTLIESLILSDIIKGHGCCLIDPHGDTAEKLLDFIPPNRINDLIYFNPADTDFPVGFNILETDNDDQKPLIASGLMGVFKKIWPDVWSARMEYILMNCVLALLDYPGATLLGINRLLVDKDYRARVVAKIRDPIVKTFWIAEFASWSEKYATEAIAPVQNKVGQFLSSSVIRNIVAQVKSTINLRRIMDDEKILIVNLSKGRIGEDNMRLLGGMIVTKIQLAAQERQNMPEKERKDFYFYVDEFQNFANESFAAILSEARKFRLNLIVAHQYIEQLEEEVAAAIFGNVGTIIAMRVGAADALAMETEFAPTFTPEDLVNITKFQIYLKLMVDGVATPPFSANTLPPIAARTDSQAKVVAVSRERYAEPRPVIEEKVLKWAGMETTPAGGGTLSPATLVATTSTPVTQEGPLGTAPTIQYPAIMTEEEQAAKETVKETMSDLEHQGDASEYLTIRPERLAAIQASIPQQQKKRPAFAHTCDRCGKKFELAIQLDTSRPVYCAECRPIIAEERKNKSSGFKSAKRAPVPLEGVGEAEVGESGFAPRNVAPNRPRLVQEPAQASKIQVVPASQVPEEEDLLTEILKAKGGAVDMHKQSLEKRAGTIPPRPTSALAPVAASSSEGEKKKRRRRRSGSGKPENGSAAPSAPSPQPSSSPSRSVAPGERIMFDT
ncbi:type IV secretion system DNA-binding domain-containing protein [Candidatus Uhrbacteria bacterium]|nr:MAG: type IV secretion system DNA-binding domain-containing protein [Candidatus Uhrbacteria bacterium]